MAVVGLMFLASCKNSTMANIEGTYVSQESGEYSVSSDTLVISMGEKIGDVQHFEIVRRSGFQMVRDGKLRPKQYRVRKYSGHFDEKASAVLFGQDKSIRVLPDQKTLVVQGRTYLRIEE